jgi:hypothetical protein
MLYRISSNGNFLKADLFNRETVEEAKEFFGAVADAAQRRRSLAILISVHTSNPLFMVDRSGFFNDFTSFGAGPEHKIALVADCEEVDYSHAYLELLAQQQGINVRHFRDEPAALEWLRPPSLAMAQGA